MAKKQDGSTLANTPSNQEIAQIVKSEFLGTDVDAMPASTGEGRGRPMAKVTSAVFNDALTIGTGKIRFYSRVKLVALLDPKAKSGDVTPAQVSRIKALLNPDEGVEAYKVAMRADGLYIQKL